VTAFDECIHEARQGTLLLGPGDDEYLEDAKRIVDAGANCTPWRRLTPAAAADAGTSPATNTADRQ
jgi:hypothetical protein